MNLEVWFEWHGIIIKIEEKAWKLIYTESRNVIFDESIVKGNLFTTHQRDLQALATEIITNPLYFIDKIYNPRDNNIM